MQIAGPAFVGEVLRLRRLVDAEVIGTGQRRARRIAQVDHHEVRRVDRERHVGQRTARVLRVFPEEELVRRSRPELVRRQQRRMRAVGVDVVDLQVVDRLGARRPAVDER